MIRDGPGSVDLVMTEQRPRTKAASLNPLPALALSFLVGTLTVTLVLVFSQL